MNCNAVAAALALVSVSLAACERDAQRVNAGICTSFSKTPSSASPALGVDASAAVEDCVRRWAYSLAGGRDSADVVADATVAACGAVLSRWNQAALGQQSQTQAGAPVEALSLTTGQPTNQMAEHNAFAHGQALLYVVQARAGRCVPPPATNGVPAGIDISR